MNAATNTIAALPTKPAITKRAKVGAGAKGAAAVSVVVCDAPLDIGAEVAALAKAAGAGGGKGSGCKVGGSAFFVGTVRGGGKGGGGKGKVGGRDGGVFSMTLEHYPGMTERALMDIARRAKARWKLSAARICHRIGKMSPGDAIVFVGAAAAHRHAAFEACRQMTDLLKTRAPFWKKEQTAKGERWVKAKGSDTAAAHRWD